MISKSGKSMLSGMSVKPRAASEAEIFRAGVNVLKPGKGPSKRAKRNVKRR